MTTPEGEAPEVIDETVEVAAAPAAEVVEEDLDPAVALKKELRGKPGDWYVIHSYAGYENKVKANLETRVQNLDVGDYIFQVEVPTEEVTEIKNGQRKQVNRKVLPGYILVRMDLTDDSWAAVRNTPGVTGFVGATSRPTALSLDDVVKFLLPQGAAKKVKSTATAAAGNYTLAIGDAQGGSFDPANYVLTYRATALLVSPRPLTLSALLQSKVYGDLSPELATRLIHEATRQGMLSTAHGTVFPARPGDLVEAGIERPRRGSIRYRGKEIAGSKSSVVCNLGIGQVAEGRQIFPNLTVAENLEVGALVPRGRPHMKESFARVYDMFPRLEERHGQYAGTLSGGEQQMLAIGRCLMAKPEMIMFDEPSLGLAPALVEEVFRIIARLHQDGLTILLVEQNVAHSLKISDRAYVLENGQIVLEGSGEELLNDDGVRQAYMGL